MRVLQVTESHEAAAGGVTTVVDQLVRSLFPLGIVSAILATGARAVAPPDGVSLTSVPPVRAGRAWGWSPALKPAVRDAFERFRPDVVHLHGAWLAPQWLAAREAVRRGIPFVVSFHGMLEPYHWSDRGTLQLLRKRLYWARVGRPAFARAAAVHAITPLEAGHLSGLLPGAMIEVIPNAISLGAIDADVRALDGVAPSPRELVIAFVGRMHPKKGVLELIEAFGRSALPAPWRVVIAGPDGEALYMSRVRQAAAASPAAARIALVGPVFGPEKWRIYRDAWVVAVPSRSETVGLVNLEAGACRTPTITTRETGLEDWAEGGGLLCDPTVTSLERALRVAGGWTAEERERRGVASRELVATRYAWEGVDRLWAALYGRLHAAA